MPHPFTPILFDLDGTIADSAPGILNSLSWTHAELGMPVPTPEELLRWVGPPLLDSFRDFAGLDEADARHALGVYRAHYRATGLLDATPYPGVLEVLHDIREAGIPLALATSKPESAATTILERFGVIDAFTVLTGASEDEVRSAKADVVAETVRRLRENGHELSRPVLVGDRIHDVEGAAVHGIPTIAVSWGYGSPAEAEDAITTADTTAELRAALGLC